MRKPKGSRTPVAAPKPSEVSKIPEGVFYSFAGNPAKIQSDLKTLFSLEGILGSFRKSHQRRLALEYLIYLALLVTAISLLDAPKFALLEKPIWLAVAFCFLSFVLWHITGASGVSAIQRLLTLIGSAFFGVFALIFLTAITQGAWFRYLATAITEPPPLKTAPVDFALAVFFSTGVVYLFTRTLYTLRLRRISPERFKQTYLSETIGSLIPRFGPGARLLLLASTFPAETTAIPLPDARSRRGYKYPSASDCLFRFRGDPGDQSSFALSAFYLRTDKIKNRKQKYKGTKHRVQLSFVFQHAALGKLTDGELEEFRRDLLSHVGRQSVPAGPKTDFSWQSKAETDFTYDVRRKGDRVLVLQDLKFFDAARREPIPELLPHPALTRDLIGYCSESLSKVVGAR